MTSFKLGSRLVRLIGKPKAGLSSDRVLSWMAVTYGRLGWNWVNAIAELPNNEFPHLIAWCSTVFTISGETDEQETLKTTYKSYYLDLVRNI